MKTTLSEADAKEQVAMRRAVYNATHHATEVSKIPSGQHFAVLCNDSVRVEDGYNGYSTTAFLTYIYFDTQVALEAWVVENYQKKTFTVISVKPVDVKLETKITLQE